MFNLKLFDAMKRKVMTAAAISLIAISLTVGLWMGLQFGAEKESTHFTYPFLIGDKTFTVTVETNWTEERAPSVSLLNSSDSRYPIELYFLGGTEQKTISFEISKP